MKESDWYECMEANSSSEVSPNKNKANSLIETANGRINFLKESEMKESNISYIFEGYYSSVLECLHAFVLLKGYKVNNHLCLGFYLRDVLKRDDLFRAFDDCRFKRNSLLYYSKQMDFATAKEAIEKCKKLIDELKKLFYPKIFFKKL